MATKWLNRKTGPSILVAVGLALAIAPNFRPTDSLSLGPIDLRNGATRTDTFKVGYDERYVIALEMDQAAAKRISPCMVNQGRAPQACASGQAWPASLGFGLSMNGSDISNMIIPLPPTAGGEYGGPNTYTWEVALVDLQPRKTYRLSSRSFSDGTSLMPAHPKLVVEGSTPGFSNQVALQNLGALVVGLFLIGGGVGWALIGWARTRWIKETRRATQILI